jgi:hypothetical protein
MSTVTTLILATYPQQCIDFYHKIHGLRRKIITLNIATEHDILSDVYLLYAEHRLTLSELAKLYGLRKIGGIWYSADPICGNAESLTQLSEQGFDVVDDREEYEEELQPELPVGVITSTRELSDKLRVSMRRAQQIYAAQVADLAAGRDLFGLGVAHE